MHMETLGGGKAGVAQSVSTPSLQPRAVFCLFRFLGESAAMLKTCLLLGLLLAAAVQAAPQGMALVPSGLPNLLRAAAACVFFECT